MALILSTFIFSTLIDTLYDSRVRVIISADEPLNRLFCKERDADHQHKQSVLMDDSNTVGNQVILNLPLLTTVSFNHFLLLQAASIFTGEEELFAYDRTVSRLSEMQTQDYWNMWDKAIN